MPAAIGAPAACSKSPVPRWGDPPSKLAARCGAFQQKNISAHTVKSVDQRSLNVMFGPVKRTFCSTGSMTAVTNASTISLTEADTTAPTAFSARNLVGDRRPKGRKIPTSAANR